MIYAFSFAFKEAHNFWLPMLRFMPDRLGSTEFVLAEHLCYLIFLGLTLGAII
jgi:hypothetical protein